MPVTDECIVIDQWNRLTATERAFERLANSDLYRKKLLIDQFKTQLRTYTSDGRDLTPYNSISALAYVITPPADGREKKDEKF